MKVELTKSSIIVEEELTLEVVLENYNYRISSWPVDQCIVDREGNLKGMIAGKDIEQCILKRQEISLDKIINRDPVTVIANRYEQKMVQEVLEKSPSIKTIPVINRENVLLYLYVTVNYVISKFYEYVLPSRYKETIRNTVMSTNERYGVEHVYIMSDLKLGWKDIMLNENKVITLQDLDELKENTDVVVLIYQYDFSAREIVRNLIKRNIKFVSPVFTKKSNRDATPFFFINQAAFDVLADEVPFNSNSFDLYDFQNIFQAINMTKKLQGVYVEIGTYKGDSANAALAYMKRSGISKKSFFLDTYEGFDYADASASVDCFWVWDKALQDTSRKLVARRLQEYDDFKLVKCNIISDDLPDEIADIAVCNIDVDMYEAVKAALEKVKGKMVMGGVILLEDYGHTPLLIGAQVAVEEFLEVSGEEFYGMYLQSGQYMLIKK